MTRFSVQRDVPLRDLTTLGVGGPVRALVHADDAVGVARALDLAHDEQRELLVLGGGSNVLASDRGVDAVVLQFDDDHVSADLSTGRVHVAAGYDWDAFVAWTVEHGLAGLECLSGIPGLCGAAPIQNIGAYGQEVGDVIETVHAVDLASGHAVALDAHECRFDYRDSRFKHDWVDRYAILGLGLHLRTDGVPTVAYAELERTLEQDEAPRSLASVRDTVLALRRGKSMVIDPDDENRRSAGSFFTNPIVDDATLEHVRSVARAKDPERTLPSWPIAPGRTKVPAARLIELSGFAKGHAQGAAGLSTRHVLALVNRGGATASDLLGLARSIRDAVNDTFGVRLRPEPVPLGFDPEEVDDLWF